MAERLTLVQHEADRRGNHAGEEERAHPSSIDFQVELFKLNVMKISSKEKKLSPVGLLEHRGGRLLLRRGADDVSPLSFRGLSQRSPSEGPAHQADGDME